MNKEKILNKIRALLAKANDEAASDNEVLIFMAKARELMIKYKISENDIDASLDDIVCSFFSSYILYFDEINTYINQHYLSDLAHVICKFNFAKTTNLKNFKVIDGIEKPYRQIRFIGKEDDIINCEEQFRFLFKKFFNLGLKQHKEACKKQVIFKGKPIKVINSYQYTNKLIFIRSYLKGTLAGLWEKYESDTIKLEKDPSYGLMVTNYNAAIIEYVETFIGKLSSVKERKRIVDDEAFEKGKEDAKKVNKKEYKRLL